MKRIKNKCYALTTKNMFNNIIEFLKNRTFDETLKGELFSQYIKYRETNDEDGLFLLYNRKNETEMQKECNGLIFEKNSNKLVCAAYPDFENELLTKDELKSVEYCEDGTVIRLYYHNDMWYTATKRCINAMDSRWTSSKTFDLMFWELFHYDNFHENPMDSILDKNKTYIFILHHVENVLVVKHRENKLVYTGCIDNVTHEMDDTFIFNNHPHIVPTLKINISLIDFENSNFESFFHPLKRGLIFKYKSDNGFKFYKHDFNEFKYVKEIRGNVPYIRSRYLELLSSPEKLSELVRLYPEYQMTYFMVEHVLNSLSNEIFYLYKNSHVKHNTTIDETNKYYRTIKQLHGQYKKTQQPITKSDVKNKLKSLNTVVLKTLLGWE